MLFKIGVLIYGYFAGALIQAGYWMGKFNKDVYKRQMLYRLLA